MQVSDGSRGKGPAASSPASPLTRKRKVVQEIPTVLSLTLLDHGPTLVRYLEATRSEADGAYYDALTHEEKPNHFMYHATQVCFWHLFDFCFIFSSPSCFPDSSYYILAALLGGSRVWF